MFKDNDPTAKLGQKRLKQHATKNLQREKTKQ
jgi:hypothetical protein